MVRRINGFGTAVRLEVDRVAGSDERRDVNDRVVHLKAAFAARDRVRLVEVTRPRWVERGERDRGQVEVGQQGRCRRRFGRSDHVGGELVPEHLPPRVRAESTAKAGDEAIDAERLDEIQRQVIIQTLRKHDFNRTETAKALGISRRALIYKLQRFRELGYLVDAE